MSEDTQRAALAALLADGGTARILGLLEQAGQRARIVGGAVRNALIGAGLSDIDIATDAPPERVLELAEAAGLKAAPTGIAHGTVMLITGGRGYEVTTLRRDVETDGRHATVAFTDSFEEDALRRDFTINQLSLAPDGTLHDYCGGLADLAARRVRFIGRAEDRIAEDYLRILRFFRFFAEYSTGGPDPDGYAACIAGRHGLKRLSRERVRAELMKLLVAPRAAAAVEAMLGAGLLLPVLGCVPHVARFAAVASEPAGSVFPAFRLAALAVAIREDGLRLRDGLRLSNEEFDRIDRLARALEAVSGRSEALAVAAVRRLAHRVGGDAVAGALVLAHASAGDEAQRLAQGLIAELGRTPPFLLTGRDALAGGAAAGPGVGRALEAAREGWIEAGCPAGRDEQAAFLERALRDQAAGTA